SLAACSPAQAISGRLQQLQSLLPGQDSQAPESPPLSIGAPAGSLEAAVQAVILRGNLEQQDAIATQDSSVMRDTSADSYYRQVDATNKAMIAQGITRIALVKIEWGDVSITGQSANATTWETWVTDYAFGGTDQS